ncbi:MAG TPA: chondroitinase-B domain-containing protein, partial [Desulfomonilia bacterium]|nr:chondroitinase-B domain-containing protein [Desulfomonilia bacterium]HRR70197.1 chondroitinase-B domain-containing protein [Desulfomonilia bacterium]
MYQKKSITLKSIGFTIVFALVFMCVPLHAAVYYVSPGGTRTSGASTEGNWTNSNCYGTISAAIQRMSGGDEVVVNDGTYTGLNNVIGRYNSINIPSGTASRYTVIRARNPFQVTIDSGQSSEWNYYGMMIYVPSSSGYIHVDGFKGINRDGSNSSFVAIMGHHVKITRCLFKTQGSANNENCVVSVTGGASHVLFEDCALTGGYRYGFIVRGVSSAPHNVIFRRCVARGDWVQSSEPNSIFAVYGHNSSAASGPYNIMFQNCIAINQNASVPDADWKPYGPWYIFKGNHDIIMNGCITLDNDQTGSTSG